MGMATNEKEMIEQPGRRKIEGTTYLQQLPLLHFQSLVNDEIEAEIRRTREIESKILRIGDEEQQGSKELEKCKQALIRRENQLADASAVTAATDESIAHLEANIHRLGKKRDEVLAEIQNKRDDFIRYCKTFQEEEEKRRTTIDDDTLSLVATKSTLNREVASLEKEVIRARLTDEVFHENQTEKLQQLQTVIEGLQSEVDRENARNDKLLSRIEGLNDALVNLRACQNIPRLEEELEAFTEEKRNLEDGIVTLQQQLPLLLNHEKKLGGLLSEQREVLRSLEQKIQDVKDLQEAYENDSKENPHPPTFRESRQVHSSEGRKINLQRPWDRPQFQAGKRHKLNDETSPL